MILRTILLLLQRCNLQELMEIRSHITDLQRLKCINAVNERKKDTQYILRGGD